MRFVRDADGITVTPDPPVAGQGITVTVPHGGEWQIYVSDSQGNVVSLGPVTAGADGTFEVDIPGDAGGALLTVTDEGEPIPSDADFNIVSSV